MGHQTTLTHGTPDDLRREVAEVISALGRAGLVIAPAYDLYGISAPWPKLAALLQAVEECGRAA